MLVNQALSDDAYWSDSAEYRTEIDSFTRVRAQGSGFAARSFIAETKDGRILQYGNASISPSSVVQAVVQPFLNQAGNPPTTPEAKSGPMSWAVSEVLDRADNYIRFEYEQDMSTGEHRPKRIRYGGKNLPAHAAVGFTYTARDDAWTRYVDGARNDLRSRLSSVTTYVGTNLDSLAGSVVRTYKLLYERSESSGRSLLTSIEPCATNPSTGIETCLPRTSFDWGKPNPNQQPGFVSRGVWANGPILTTNGTFGAFSYSALHAEYFAFADFNNDGRTDLLEQRETSPNLSMPDDRFMTAAINDANPKGRGTYKNQYRYFHNTGSGFVTSTYSISTGEDFVVLGTGDFNGDGAPDIIVETKVGATLAQRICVSPLATSTTAPPSAMTFACGAPLPASVGVSNVVDRLPFVVDAIGNGLSSFYGPHNYGSFGEPLGATLCVVSNPAAVTRESAPAMSCNLQADAPAGVLRPVERNVQFIENQRFDHISFEQMVDFSGTGKPNNVRWTKPYLTKFSDDGGTTVTSLWRWLNNQPTIVATDFVLNNASAGNAIASYTYPTYNLPSRPNPVLNEFPYQFDVGKYGSNAADFNGSGYSSTAYGFIEYQSGSYNPNRTDFTVCLSTGRALDCRVRKKYSGLDVTDGSTTEPLLRYRQLRSVGQFEGDGAPTLLMERLSMGANQLKPVGTGRMQFCRLMGDDTTGGSGANDQNLDCQDAALPQEIFRGYQPEDINTTGRAFPVFFGDFIGTGRTQIMSYKGGSYQNGVWVENGTWELHEPIDRSLPGQALDRIHRVTNGVGHVSTVEYADGVASGIVTRSGTSTLTYPRYVTSGVGKIVRRVTVNQGGSATKSTRYDYQDAAIDVSGRGSLGFARVVSTEEQSNITTTSTYAQSWPFTGMVTATTATRSGITLSNTANVLRARAIPQANGVPTTFTYVASSSTSRADLNGASLGSEVMGGASGIAPFADEPEVTYDDWGNLLRVRTDAIGSSLTPTAKYTTVTVNTYRTPDTANWLVGLVENARVAKKDSVGGTTIVRERQFVYQPGRSGRVQSETVEPNGTPDLKLVHQYGYDAFGNLSSKTTTWRDLQTGVDTSATESTGFDSNGRFPTTITNALSHVESRAYNERNGAVRQLTGPNNLTTVWRFDAFDRVTEELRADGTSTRKYRKQCTFDCPVVNATSVEMTELFKGPDRIAVPSLTYMNAIGQPLRMATYGFTGSPISSDKQYDGRGRLEVEYQPRYPDDPVAKARSLVYDDLNRVISTAEYDEQAPSTGYATSTDFNGFVQTHVNAKSQRRTEHRDALNRIQRVTDDVSKSTDFGYDTFNNLVRTVDPNGNVIQVMYDTLGRRTRLTDPNLGRIDYFPDARGLLWRQQSPRQRAAVPAQFTRMEYDLLGRMTGRYEPDLESHWVFDTATKGVGQLAEAYTGTPLNKDYRRIHTYDSLGRPSTTTQILSDGSYVQSSEYDDWGRKITETLQRVPSPATPDAAKVFQARYNGWGYLAQWQRAATTIPTAIPARVLWRQVSANARQQATLVRYGNGLSETNVYDLHANRLRTRTVETVVQRTNDSARLNESYLYDALGNVNSRTVGWDSTSFNESFTYDTLNRLRTSQVNNQALQTFEYDAVGNLTRKTGVGGGTSGSIVYPTQGASSVRPNAVSSVTGGTFGTGSYAYDDNGNLITAPGSRTATWTSFDMPLSIAKGASTATFTYGPEHQRTKQVRGDGTVITYAGAQEVETASSGAKTIKTYWPMGLGVEIDRPATGTPPVVPATQLSWWHKDRLGSVIAITSDTGVFRERLAFDAWGKRRTLTGALSGTTPTPDTIDGVIDNRGFTGHEMLDQLDLVHMNGRIYDPLLARFLSADPILQDPMNAQSYNRYSYVMNNPTNLTDPTGFAAIAVTSTRLVDPSIVCTGAGCREWMRDLGHQQRMTNAIRSRTTNGVEQPQAKSQATNASKPGCIGPCVSSLLQEQARELREAAEAHRRLPWYLRLLSDGRAEELENAADMLDSLAAAERGEITAAGVVLGAAIRGLKSAADKKYGGARGAKHEAKKAEALSGPAFQTTRQATAAAEALGYRRIAETSHGQAVYTNGKNYITRDIDGHKKGGAWKVADTLKALGSKETRTGTYDATLKVKVGD